jgi:hypothetical protein
MRISCVLWLCVLSATLVFGQANAPADKAAADQAPAAKAVEEVKAYCSTIDDYKHDADPKLFADASDSAKPAWRRVGTERELDALTDAQFQHSTIARVWFKGDKVVAVETDYTTAAGYWELSAEYCFREDGTLAAVHSEYHDAVEDYVSLRDEAFDESGTVIDTKTQVFDANTKKPKKLSGKAAAAEQHAPVYKTTKDLPFHRLLRAQASAASGSEAHR